MFELRPAAKEQLDIHFAGKDKELIRIYLASGCGGQRLSLALDERKDDDQVFEADGYSFLMEPALFEQAKPVTITFDAERGFGVESKMKFAEGGGCGSCGCSGSCG